MSLLDLGQTWLCAFECSMLSMSPRTTRISHGGIASLVCQSPLRLQPAALWGTTFQLQGTTPSA